MTEAVYRTKLKDKLRTKLPGCFIIENDPRVNQGVPDLLILFKKRWGALELKASSKSRKRPNQQYYVDLFNDMSYASFIHPKNEEQVLHDLQLSLGASR